MNLDEDLLERVKAGEPWTYRSWEPDRAIVVLGRGNKAELEVYEERCQHDNVPVLRRRGGGGTVVLYPGILVISVVKSVKYHYHFKEYFHQINRYIIESLQSMGIADLNQQGHSDICIRDRKILGSSMYRSKELLFYTASLMVSNQLHIIDQYLKHPSKEPDYRRRRTHQEFLTTIANEYSEISVKIVKNTMDTQFQRRIPEIE
jgi:lipoate-protein ligase A